MSDTGFVLRPEQRARLAGMHVRQPDGTLQVLPSEEPQEPEFFGGGGGLYSTGPDYLRFLRMLLGDGQLDGVRILRPETVAEMGRNQIGELTVGALTTVVPEDSHSIEFFPGMVKQWGLAAMITTAGGTGRSRRRQPGLGGASPTPTSGSILREQVTGVLLTQILPFADPGVLDLFAQFERAIYACHTAQGQLPA